MSVISKKHQITVPVGVLREAGLGPDLVGELAGALDRRVYPEEYLEELRREWRWSSSMRMSSSGSSTETTRTTPRP
jgi:hypothetical protein